MPERRVASRPAPADPTPAQTTDAPERTQTRRDEPATAQPPANDRLVRSAMDLRGTPYLNGGSDPRGFDCSGFTQYVFGQTGARLPREVRDQFRVGTVVPAGRQEPGDLIFFTTTEPGPSHVGIVIGGDTFVHAPSSRGVVRIERLSLPYWSRRVIGVRRIAAN